MLNAVDHVVKNYMMDSPSLFPNRFSVLAFMFLNAGGGYHWNDKGEADCIYGMPAPRKTIKTSDLTKPTAMAKSLHEAKHELDLLERKHRGKYIDLYAQEPPKVQSIDSIGMLRTISTLEHTLLGTLPANVTPEWAHAANEVASACEHALKRARAQDNVPPTMKNLEAAFTNALNVLEPITHARQIKVGAVQNLQRLWQTLGMNDSPGP